MNLEKYVVPKYTEVRGFLYIATDTSFPDFIKIGVTTNAQKRLDAYNADRPFPTVEFLWISEMLDNAIQEEKDLLVFLQKEETRTALGKREWLDKAALKNVSIFFEIAFLEDTGNIV